MTVRSTRWDEGLKRSVPTEGYEGATLAVRWEYNADYEWKVAEVWDGEKVVTVGADYGPNSRESTVDATPEVVLLAREYTALTAADAALNVAWHGWLRLADEALEPMRGDTLTVVRGRKVPVGTKGVMFWTGESAWGDRVGFTGEDGGTYWTALRNVEFDPDPERLPGFFPKPYEDRLADGRAMAAKKWPLPVMAMAA